MTTGPGDKPSDSSPGRPAADTPQKLVVRPRESNDSIGGGDTAVAMASRTSDSHVDPGPEASESATMAAELIGTTLVDRYLVTRKVGQGGMGAVYEATHTLLGKRVAVKVLLAKYAKRQSLVQRLEQEAKLASSVGNEHIIDITDFGQTADGRTFVVMEMLDGESLAEAIARDTQLPEQRILRIASQVASALAAAHAKGIVHRDIKPENVFLLRRKDDDFVKVVDFGISKSLRATDEEEESPRLTQTGMVLGTPLYMSPEQARGDDNLDHRVDIYALGVIMYEAATGRVPFTGNNYLSVISQVLGEQPISPRELRPELTEEFEAIVLRAMAKDREQRYASAADMANDLSALLDDPTHSTERAKITGPRPKGVAKAKSPRSAIWIAVAAILVAAVVVVVMLVNGGGAPTPAPLPVVAVQRDAAAPPDAPPAIKKITLHVTSTPPGATIFKESEEKGRAPVDLDLVVKDKEVRISAQLDGWEDATAVVNPEEYKDGDTIPLRFTKKKLAPLRPPNNGTSHPNGSGSGSAVAPTNHAGGEFIGYPGGKSGGTVPKK